MTLKPSIYWLTLKDHKHEVIFSPESWELNCTAFILAGSWTALLLYWLGAELHCFYIGWELNCIAFILTGSWTALLLKWLGAELHCFYIGWELNCIASSRRIDVLRFSVLLLCIFLLLLLFSGNCHEFNYFLLGRFCENKNNTFIKYFTPNIPKSHNLLQFKGQSC